MNINETEQFEKGKNVIIVGGCVGNQGLIRELLDLISEKSVVILESEEKEFNSLVINIDNFLGEEMLLDEKYTFQESPTILSEEHNDNKLVKSCQPWKEYGNKRKEFNPKKRYQRQFF